MDSLDPIIEQIRQELTDKNALRDTALARSRQLIRLCAGAIRATHREDWDQAAAQIEQASEAALILTSDLAQHPDLFHTGYAQDALKEYVEAHLTFALIRNRPLPTPKSLQVEPATYLAGLSEAATEMRRRILDIIRHRHTAEAERLLASMDSVYDAMITLDFPDAITRGLRRRTDVLRGVLERTRGDLTNSLRRQQLQDALRDLEGRLEPQEPV